MNDQYPFQIKQLPYSYVGLAPYCDADTLYFHHHQYYAEKVRKLNRLAARFGLQDWSLEDIISNKINIPKVWLDQLKDAAGAVYNHELYFDGVQGRAGDPPPNALVKEIIATYGTIQQFEKLLLEAAESLPGAGWVWLVTEGNSGLHIVVTDNHETVELHAVSPIFTVDLWEHAYFLDHQFDKGKYMDTWFSLLDWGKADARFRKTQA